jgi:hypothetical protein
VKKEMKKLLINFVLVMILGLLLLSAGCGGAEDYYNLSGWTPPVDAAFTSFVNSNTTPSSVATWIYYNYTYQYSTSVKSPYNFWKTKIGDCSECAALVSYVSHQHGYQTWQIYITYVENKAHRLCVYKVGSLYYYTSKEYCYQAPGWSSFAAVVAHHDTKTTYTVQDFVVFDWYGNVVVEPKNPELIKSRGLYDGE